MKLGFLLIIVFCFHLANGQNIGSLNNEKPFLLKGGLDLRGIFFHASGIAPQGPPASFVASGNLVPSIYGISFPLTFSYTSNGNPNFQQPFNQFGISPTYKWFTLHLGYRNISYQPYTLNGHTIKGIGAEVAYHKFHASFIYGRLNKATTIDTLSQSLVSASYTRKGYAWKIGYGDTKNFMDFSFLRAADDTNSLLVNRKMYDTGSINSNLFAAQNAVVGMSCRFTMLKHLVFESDAALSVYTQDIQSPLAIENPGNGLLKSVNQFVYINGTSGYATAFNASLGYQQKKYSFKLKFERIDPNFQSMGTYFLATDISNITIAPTFAFFKNKLRVNGSFGIQHDNLNKVNDSTTRRYIGSANISALFSKTFSIDFNFNNYSTNQAPSTTLFADTLKITQATYNLGFTPRWVFLGSQHTQLLLISAQQSLLSNYNSSYTSGQQSSNINALNSFISYQVQFNKTGNSIGFSLNYTNMKSNSLTQTNYGVTLNGMKNLIKRRMTVSASASYLLDNQSGADGNIVNGSILLKYFIVKKHSIGLNAFYTNNRPKVVSTGLPSYEEVRAEVFYDYKF